MKLFRYFLLVPLCAMLLTGQGCTKALSPEARDLSQRITLQAWTVVDDADVYSDVVNDYKLAHPNVQINIRRLRLEEFESELLNALAEDRGPDLFLIHNDWVDGYLSKIEPMPTSTKVAYSVVTGTVKKQQAWEVRNEPSISMKTYKERYADVVLKDTIRAFNGSQKIVGMAPSVDTMVLFYNKDLLNAANIPNPPEYWGAFQDQVQKLTKLDEDRRLVQAGAGIGTIKNVERGTDLLVALMMQSGARMADESGAPQFQAVPPDMRNERTEPPAYSAIQFFADFANKNNTTYTWNEDQPNSLEAFLQGKIAFFFGYSYHLPQIRARAPRLNLGITHLPQIENNGVKNIANYWIWVVSKKTEHPDLAWNFLQFVHRPEEATKILAKTNRPASHKALLKNQLEDERVGIFASQVLTADSWYRGKEPRLLDGIFAELIDRVHQEPEKLRQWVNAAAEKVAQTL